MGFMAKSQFMAICIFGLGVLLTFCSCFPKHHKSSQDAEDYMASGEDDLREVDKIMANVATEQAEIESDIALAEAAKKNSTVRTDSNGTSMVVTTKIAKRSISGFKLGINPLLLPNFLIPSDRLIGAEPELGQAAGIGIDVDVAAPDYDDFFGLFNVNFWPF